MPALRVGCLDYFFTISSLISWSRSTVQIFGMAVRWHVAIQSSFLSILVFCHEALHLSWIDPTLTSFLALVTWGVSSEPFEGHDGRLLCGQHSYAMFLINPWATLRGLTQSVDLPLMYTHDILRWWQPWVFLISSWKHDVKMLTRRDAILLARFQETWHIPTYQARWDVLYSLIFVRWCLMLFADDILRWL